MSHQYIIFIKQYDDPTGICYKVSDELNKLIFYVLINRKEKIIYYYTSDDFKQKPIAIVSFSDPNKPMDNVPGIPQSLSNRINFQMYKAFLANNFPETMNYVSL